MRAAPLAAQRVALQHAEPVLFVDDREADVLEVGALLDQRVRPDHEVEHARFHLLVDLTLAGSAHAAGQQRHAHGSSERRREAEVVPDLVVARQFLAREQPLERLIVLRREHLGRRHEHGLMSGADGGEHRRRRDHRLARSHVALQQPGHRLTAEHVVADLGQHPLLRAGELERQRADELVEEVSRHRDRRRVRTLSRLPFATEHRELDRKQFLERDPFLRLVDVFQPLGEVNDGKGLCL